MANPQCEDGYTRIANELLTALCRAKLTLYEWRVLIAVVRLTYGYNRKTDQISIKQIGQLTGIQDTASVSKTLRELHKKDMITLIKQKNRLILGIQKNYDRWRVGSPPGDPCAEVGPSTKLAPQPTTSWLTNQLQVGPRTNNEWVEQPTSPSVGLPESTCDVNRLDDDHVSPKDSIKDRYKDSMKDNKRITARSQPKAVSDPEPGRGDEKIFVSIPLIHKGERFGVTETLVAQYEALYPGLDVRQTLRDIAAWNMANPTRRKTRNGIQRHIVGWLAKNQNKGINRKENTADPFATLRARYERGEIE